MPPRKPETIEDKAYRTALSRLNRAAMSRARLDAKLASAGFAQDVRAAALDRLEAAGLLSDEAYARALVDEFLAAGAGPALVRQKLSQRGVSDVLADLLLDERASPADALEQARTFARKKLRTMTRLDPLTARRRLSAALARRGYDTDTVEQVVTQLVADGSSESD